MLMITWSLWQHLPHGHKLIPPNICNFHDVKVAGLGEIQFVQQKILIACMVNFQWMCEVPTHIYNDYGIATSHIH